MCHLLRVESVTPFTFVSRLLLLIKLKSITDQVFVLVHSGCPLTTLYMVLLLVNTDNVFRSEKATPSGGRKREREKEDIGECPEGW